MALKKNKSNAGGPFDDNDDYDGYGGGSSNYNSLYDDYEDDSDSLFNEESGKYWPKPKKKSNPVPYIIAGIVVLLALFLFLYVGKGSTGIHAEVITPTPQEVSTPLVNTPSPAQAVENTPAPTATPAFENTNRYFRRQLNETQKKAYDKISNGVGIYEETISFEVATEEDIHMLARYVSYDYPEYFWFRGAWEAGYTLESVGADLYRVVLKPEYEYTENECQGFSLLVETAFQPKIDELSNSSDYDKAIGVYEYLIENTKYDLAYMGKTIYEMAKDHRAVCEGYARATQYMLTKLGVETLYVVGKSDNGSGEPEDHAWNIVKLDGEYYNVDTTWGDPALDDGTQAMSHGYLCVTDADLQNTHVKDNSNPYPVCSSTKYNWFRRNNRYMETYDEAVIASCIPGRGIETEFQFATESLYKEAMKKLFDDGRIYDIAYKAAGSSYARWRYDENARVIAITLN